MQPAQLPPCQVVSVVIDTKELGEWLRRNVWSRGEEIANALETLSAEGAVKDRVIAAARNMCVYNLDAYGSAELRKVLDELDSVSTRRAVSDMTPEECADELTQEARARGQYDPVQSGRETCEHTLHPDYIPGVCTKCGEDISDA